MNSVLNFRDAGGYITSEGIEIRKRMIFRSGNIDGISGNDIKDFYMLNIKSIIDLRQTDEHKKRNSQINGIKTLNIPINTTHKTREVLRPFIGKRKDSKEDIISAITGIYKDMVEMQMPEVSKIFQHLSNIDSYPVLIHCHIGKDRTGFIIALIQMLLELDINSIKRDYLLSNDYLSGRTKKLTRLIKIFSLGSFPVGNFKFSSTAADDYIDAVFTIINEKYGGIYKYLNLCGVDNDSIMKIREILLSKSKNQ